MVFGYYPKVSNSVLHNVAIEMNSNLTFFFSPKSLHGHCRLLFPNIFAGAWAGGLGPGYVWQKLLSGKNCSRTRLYYVRAS